MRIVHLRVFACPLLRLLPPHQDGFSIHKDGTNPKPQMFVNLERLTRRLQKLNFYHLRA